jgi:hypothetical protein
VRGGAHHPLEGGGAFPQRRGDPVQVVVLLDEGLLPRQVTVVGLVQGADLGDLVGDDGPLPGLHVGQRPVLRAKRRLACFPRRRLLLGNLAVFLYCGHDA